MGGSTISCGVGSFGIATSGVAPLTSFAVCARAESTQSAAKMDITAALMTMPDGTCGFVGSRPCPVRRCLAVRSRVVLLSAPTRPALPATFSILRVFGIGDSSVCSQLRWVALGWVIAFSYCVVLDFESAIASPIVAGRNATARPNIELALRMQPHDLSSGCFVVCPFRAVLGCWVVWSSCRDSLLRFQYQGA